MCGIAGFVTTSPACGCEALLARMTDAIRHRAEGIKPMFFALNIRNLA
jgi:asparagine synthetase B (glutamine-hydrolysing)